MSATKLVYVVAVDEFEYTVEGVYAGFQDAKDAARELYLKAGDRIDVVVEDERQWHGSTARGAVYHVFEVPYYE